MNVSPQLERLLRHVAGDPERQPACLDDAAETLDDLSDAELTQLCGPETETRADGYFAPLPCSGKRREQLLEKLIALRRSGTLRQRLGDELAELDLAAMGDGWIEAILQQEEAPA